MFPFYSEIIPKFPKSFTFLSLCKKELFQVISAAVAIVCVTALCLSFKETRLMGVFGLVLLLYLHPISLAIVAVVVVTVAGVVFYFHKRRSFHALRIRDSRRD